MKMPTLITIITEVNHITTIKQERKEDLLTKYTKHSNIKTCITLNQLVLKAPLLSNQISTKNL